MADSAAIRRSHAIASSQPPPSAIALTAAIVTTGAVSISRSRPCMPSSSSLPAAASIVVNALMSAPAQNSIGLAEAITRLLTVPAPLIASQSLRNACTTSGEIEFAGGRSSQAIATAPRDSSFTGLSSQPASGLG